MAENYIYIHIIDTEQFDNWYGFSISIGNTTSQLIKYAYIDLITDFRILVISESIFQAEDFGTVGALNTLMTYLVSSRFCDNRKILFLTFIWCVF